MQQEAISFVEHEVFTKQVDTETTYSSAQQLQSKHLVDRFLRETDLKKSLMLWLENSGYNINNMKKISILSLLRKAISDIDKKLSKQINCIIHHSEFQALESGWRGVLYLVNQKENNDKNQKVKIKVLDCSWTTLSKDINKAIEFDQSEFFKLVYNNEYDMSGGEPFGVLIGNYQISHQNRKGTLINDMDVLKEITRTAAAAFSPFITSAAPSFFGADKFSDLASHIDFTYTFNQIEYTKWNSLREMDDARFLGLTLPYILMRAPYKNDGSRNEAFRFSEVIKNPQKDHLWGEMLLLPLVVY